MSTVVITCYCCKKTGHKVIDCKIKLASEFVIEIRGSGVAIIIAIVTRMRIVTSRLKGRESLRMEEQRV